MPRPPLIAESLDYPLEGRPRVIIDWDAETITFEHCHEPRGFLSSGVEPRYVCPFTDLRSSSDFLTGDHSGAGTKAILAAGKLVHSHTTAAEMASIFVSTSRGRTRVFSHWENFAELREALRSIAPIGSRPPWSEDPRMLPVFLVVVFAVVGGIIYWLL